MVNLNEHGSIRVLNTKGKEQQCPITRDILLKGEKAIRMTRYRGDEAYGGVWIKLDYQTVENFKEILTDLLENYDLNSKTNYRTGINISKYNPSDLTVSKGNNCHCSVSMEPIEKGEYALSISENHSHDGNRARVKTEYLEALRDDILSWSNLDEFLEDPHEEKKYPSFDKDKEFCDNCKKNSLQIQSGGNPELGYKYLQCENCGKCYNLK